MQENKKTRPFVVYSLKMAHELINMGFECIDTSFNIQHPQYLVYYFEDTEDFRAALEALQRGRPHA